MRTTKDVWYAREIVAQYILGAVAQDILWDDIVWRHIPEEQQLSMQESELIMEQVLELAGGASVEEVRDALKVLIGGVPL